MYIQPDEEWNWELLFTEVGSELQSEEQSELVPVETARHSDRRHDAGDDVVEDFSLDIGRQFSDASALTARNEKVDF